MVSKRLAIIGGLVVGLLTLRSLRNRRSGGKDKSTESADTTESDAHAELETAADHAVAAVEHARVATTKALEERKQKA